MVAVERSGNVDASNFSCAEVAGKHISIRNTKILGSVPLSLKYKICISLIFLFCEISEVFEQGKTS